VMIGNGGLFEPAVKCLREARLGEVSWLPGSRDDIPEQLQSMDIFVLCSLREGISNTVLEAMASGLPVIASRTGGNPELIADGINGMLVPPGDRSALASAIGIYLRDPDRRMSHGKESRRRAVDLFSIDSMVDKYRHLYESALGVQTV